MARLSPCPPVLLLPLSSCLPVPLSPCPLQLLQGAEPVGAADGVRPVQRTLQPLPGAGVCLESLQLGRHEGGLGAGETALATTPRGIHGNAPPTQVAVIVGSSESDVFRRMHTRAHVGIRVHNHTHTRTHARTHTPCGGTLKSAPNKPGSLKNTYK